MRVSVCIFSFVDRESEGERGRESERQRETERERRTGIVGGKDKQIQSRREGRKQGRAKPVLTSI